MSNVKEKKIPYMPGLDGLRALAVLSVIAYHLNVPHTVGGFLGVTVFFVLSGYLITSLLVYEWNHTHTIDLKSFWIRRAKRLLPAMFFLLIVLNVLIPIIRPELVSYLHKDSVAAFFYYSNWHYIFQHLSYFESFRTTSLLTHFWSLAIEEQYYIVWAIVFLFVFRKIKSVHKIFFWLVGIAIVSAVWMGILYQPYHDPSRVYYGTDTRLFSLLIGSSFAIALPSYRLKDGANALGRWTFETVGFIGLATFISMVMFTNQYESFIYRGGMFLVSVTTGLMIVSIASPSAKVINKIMGIKPLKWIGMRSYGIYLWHFPISTLMNSGVNTNEWHFWKSILELILIFGAATISYELIEKPIRYGHFQFRFKQTSAVLVGLCVLLISVNQLPKPSAANTAMAQEQAVVKSQKQQVLMQNENKVNKVSANKDILDGKITAIGDSVLVNPSPYLKEMIPNINIDAKIGRQMWDIPSIVQTLKNQGQLGDVVLFVIGSNGLSSDKTFDQIMKIIGKDRTVVFVNVRVPKPWESSVNKELKNKAKEYSNMRVIDWYSASANHSEYFLNDGVHLKEVGGAEVYAKFLVNELKKINKKEA